MTDKQQLISKQAVLELLKAAYDLIDSREGDLSTEDGDVATSELNAMIVADNLFCETFGEDRREAFDLIDSLFSVESVEAWRDLESFEKPKAGDRAFFDGSFNPELITEDTLEMVFTLFNANRCFVHRRVSLPMPDNNQQPFDKSDMSGAYVNGVTDVLSYILDNGEAIPEEELQRIGSHVISKAGDYSFFESAPDRKISHVKAMLEEIAHCLNHGFDVDWAKLAVAGVIDYIGGDSVPDNKVLVAPVDERYGDKRPKITSHMKAVCIGEFSFTTEETCICNDGIAENGAECEFCRGEYEYLQERFVPWDTCKEIYKAMVTAAFNELAATGKGEEPPSKIKKVDDIKSETETDPGNRQL